MEKFTNYAVIRIAHGLQIWCNRHKCNVAVIGIEWNDGMPKCKGCVVCGPQEPSEEQA